MNDLVAVAIPAPVWWALLAIVNRPRVKPDKPATGGADVPSEPVAELPPAPKFLGFLFLRPYYQKGERITLNTGPETHGCDPSKPSPWERQTHGIVDNGSGPYSVALKVWDQLSGAVVPVYKYDGGPRCDGEVVPSGFFDVYALAARSYSAVGSLVNCNEFVPLYDDENEARPRFCGPRPCPVGPTPTAPGQLTPMVIELQIRNRFGVTGAPWRQVVDVEPSTCVSGGGA